MVAEEPESRISHDRSSEGNTPRSPKTVLTRVNSSLFSVRVGLSTLQRPEIDVVQQPDDWWAGVLGPNLALGLGNSSLSYTE